MPIKNDRLLLAIVGSMSLLASGCPLEKWEATPETWGAEEKTQASLFLKCMEALPAGVQAWRYNEWNEVVLWCEKQARHGVAVRKEGRVEIGGSYE